MIPRISPQEVYPRVQSGDSLLVCAYASDEQCQGLHLAGALLPSAFRTKIQSLPKAQEIIFYCA